MRLTSIVALCVAAAPVLAEQKYPAWMGNAMDFAQTTTGGDYDVDTSTPKETFYWNGAAEVAFLAPKSVGDSSLFGEMDYLTVQNVSLNDIQSEALSEVWGYERQLSFEDVANENNIWKVFYSSRYPRVITTKKMNSTTVRPADLPKIKLVRDGEVETLTETDRINGFLWFNNLTIKESQDLTIKGKITTDDNIANRCVVKMFIAKGGMDDLKKVIRKNNKDKLPKMIAESPIGGDLTISSYFEGVVTLPLGFLATCEAGEIEDFEVTVTNRSKNPAGFKSSLIEGDRVNLNAQSAEAFNVAQYRVKTPIYSYRGTPVKNPTAAEIHSMYQRPIDFERWFQDLPMSGEVSSINLDYVDLTIQKDDPLLSGYFAAEDDEDFNPPLDNYTPELLFASMEFDLPLKTPKQGIYELLLVQKSNITHGGPRRYPFFSIVDKDEQNVLFFNRAIGDGFRYDLISDEKQKYERKIYEDVYLGHYENDYSNYGENYNETRIGKPQKIARIALSNAEKTNLNIKAYPYLMRHIVPEVGHQYTNTRILRNRFRPDTLRKIDFPNWWLRFSDNPAAQSPEGFEVNLFGRPMHVGNNPECSKDEPCFADEQNFISSHSEDGVEAEVGFSLYIKDPDQAYFRSITLADLGEINGVNTQKIPSAISVEDAKRLADDMFD